MYFPNNLHRWILSISMTLAALGMPATVSADLSAACDAPSLLLPTDADRQPEGAVADSHCYRLDLPSAGLLHLDLSVAGESPSRPRLAVADEGGAPVELETLERSATEWLSSAPSGTYFLEITAEDPRRPLPAYRLSSRFLPLEKSDTDGELEPDPETYKSDTDGELEPDPETSSLLRQALCRSLDGDDHGDNFACATETWRHAAGELGNDWGDDADVFRFRLCGWQTVEIATAGDVDTHGQLYDGSGQRLDGDDAGGKGGNFRIVRTLGPGAYFVRVEGVSSAGAYKLALRTAGR